MVTTMTAGRLYEILEEMNEEELDSKLSVVVRIRGTLYELPIN